MITGAAAIMAAVFISFAAAPIATVSQMGVGLTVAILLDATVVRIVLLPALMLLLGDRVWRTPAWLDRLLPELEQSAFESDLRDVDVPPNDGRKPVEFDGRNCLNAPLTGKLLEVDTGMGRLGWLIGVVRDRLAAAVLAGCRDGEPPKKS